MTAAAIIERIRDNGGEIALVADDLRLRVPASLINELADAVRAEKDAIKRALKRETGDLWQSADYRAYYDERAGIAEFDGGQSREEAKTIAFECCVVEWLDRNPAPSHPDRCAWCGRPDAEGRAIVPFGSHRIGHAWLHPECWSPWRERRRGEAVSALEELGLLAPASFQQTDRSSAS